jgi:hypothetical protein
MQTHILGAVLVGKLVVGDRGVTAARQVMLQDAAARVMAGRSEGFPGDAHALLADLSG